MRTHPVPYMPLPLAAKRLSTACTVLRFLDRTHREIDQALSRLLALAENVQQHRTGPAIRQEAAHLLVTLDGHAREHHEDEERHIFPALLSSPDGQLAQTVWKLLQDHGWIEECWQHISPMLVALSRDNGNVDPALLLEGVQLFRQVYLDHMALEESVAYPASSPLMTDAAALVMRQEMEARRERHARQFATIGPSSAC